LLDASRGKYLNGLGDFLAVIVGDLKPRKKPAAVR
jgi:hypothetical protein